MELLKCLDKQMESWACRLDELSEIVYPISNTILASPVCSVRITSAESHQMILNGQLSHVSL